MGKMIITGVEAKPGVRVIRGTRSLKVFKQGKVMISIPYAGRSAMKLYKEVCDLYRAYGIQVNNDLKLISKGA